MRRKVGAASDGRSSALIRVFGAPVTAAPASNRCATARARTSTWSGDGGRSLAWTALTSPSDDSLIDRGWRGGRACAGERHEDGIAFADLRVPGRRQLVAHVR